MRKVTTILLQVPGCEIVTMYSDSPPAYVAIEVYEAREQGRLARYKLAAEADTAHQGFFDPAFFVACLVEELS